MYRFLLSRRWVGGLALAIVVALVSVLLGLWQWDRREQRLQRIAVVTDNYDRAPVPLGDVLPDAAAVLPDGAEYTPVVLEGRYLPGAGLLLRNRSLDGRPGYHSLVPFETSEGAVVLVDRGWVPVGSTGAGPDDVPPPPGDIEQAVVRLRPGEGASPRGAPDGQLQRIDLDAVAALLPADTGRELRTGAYGVLAEESPAPASAPTVLPRPPVDEGPHLSYALQWFVYALASLVGFVVLARRTAHQAVQGQPVPAARRPPRARRSRPSAEDEEDALLDAAERAGDRP